MYKEQSELDEKLANLTKSIYEVALICQRIGKWGKGIYLLELGIDFAQEALPKANLQIVLAEILMRRGQYVQAQELLQTAVMVAKEMLASDQKTPIENDYSGAHSDALLQKIMPKTLLARAYFALGELHYFLYALKKESTYSVAWDYIEQARELFTELDDKQNMAQVLGRMGVMLDSQGDEVGAREHYDRAIQLADEIEFEAAKTLPLAHIGLILSRQGDFKQALIYHREALEVSQRTQQADRIMHALAHIGITKFNLGADVSIALSKCKEALTIAEKLEYQSAICLMLRRLGDLHLEANHQEEAREHFEKLQHVAEKNGFGSYLETAHERLCGLS